MGGVREGVFPPPPSILSSALPPLRRSSLLKKVRGGNGGMMEVGAQDGGEFPLPLALSSFPDRWLAGFRRVGVGKRGDIY